SLRGAVVDPQPFKALQTSIDPPLSECAYCGSQQDISNVHTRTGTSVFADCAGLCAGFWVTSATTTGLAAVPDAAFFTCLSAARAEEIKKQPATRIAARMIKSPMLSV